ncbi:hypothetical protein OXX69_008355 [Metschnikowia pulcherrima]
MKDLCARRTQSSREESKAGSLETTHNLPVSSDAAFSVVETLVSRHNPDSSDAELSDAELNDAETLDSTHKLESIGLVYNDSKLKEVPRLNGDLESISGSSEDKQIDQGLRF